MPAEGSEDSTRVLVPLPSLCLLLQSTNKPTRVHPTATDPLENLA